MAAGNDVWPDPWPYHVRIHRSRFMALDILAVVDHSWPNLANPANQSRDLCAGYPCRACTASPQGEQQPKHLCAART